MSVLKEYLDKNSKTAYEFAKNNTKYNEQSKPTISKDDEWVNETEWDELYNTLKKKVDKEK